MSDPSSDDGLGAKLSALLAQLAAPLAEPTGVAPEVLRKGAVVGRFEILRELGRGGCGVVYEAFDPDLGRKVAIKTLRPSRRAVDETEHKRLREEAEAVARLDHPSILTVYDAGTCASGPYLVLELLEGEPMDVRLSRGPLSPVEAFRFGADVANALAHAHARGVLHRDLKPANVFLTEAGGVKLLDFGLAHFLGTAERIRGGTPAYMAPEQARGEPVDERADVFGWGVLVYEALERRRPFEVRDGRSAVLDGAAPAALASSLPAPAVSLLERCLSAAPARRPRTGQALLEEALGVQRALEPQRPSPTGRSDCIESTLTTPTGDGEPDAPRRVPVLFRLLACDQVLEGSSGHALDVDEVLFVRGVRRKAERTTHRKASRLVLSVADAYMSSSHARLLRSAEGTIIEDLRSKNGTKVNGSPVERALLRDGDLLELGRTFFLYREDAWSSGTEDVESCVASWCGLPTMVQPLAQELGECARVARSALPVLVVGEHGTGKERLARAIHDASGRHGLFVTIRCGAISEGLVESESSVAREGTLFLDEIADLPLEAQAAVLRVMQGGEALAAQATPVQGDLRIVATTQRDLEERVAAGTFRADLYARLTVFTVRLPPVRQRREDLGILLARSLERSAERKRPPILSKDAARALLSYGWPLNVRELEQCVGAAVSLCQGHLQLQHLPEAVRQCRTSGHSSLPIASDDLPRP